MPIISSYGALQRIAAPQPTFYAASHGGATMAGSYAYAYSTIYRTQPNVRTVVDFLARNIAQLGLPVYRRVSDTDRERIGNHPLAKLIRNPNPYTTRYRLFETLMQDLGVYFNAFWIKVRLDERTVGVVRLPPEQVTVEGGIFPTNYKWNLPNGEYRDFAPSEVVHFGGYDPDNSLIGLSPIETLRRLLAEDFASSVYRAAYWRNNARPGMVIKRPKEAGRWGPDQVADYRRQLGEFEGGPNAGRSLVLQDGMEPVWPPHSFRDSEFIPSRKLTREEVAAAYHVPLPM